MLTPVGAPQRLRTGWIVVWLVLGAVSQPVMLRPSRPAELVGAALMGIAAQAGKIAVDTLVQRDADDDFRGRAFAFYDVLYNAAFVGAAALGGAPLPDTGSRRTVAVLAVGYLAAAVATDAFARDPRDLAVGRGARRAGGRTCRAWPRASLSFTISDARSPKPPDLGQPSVRPAGQRLLGSGRARTNCRFLQGQGTDPVRWNGSGRRWGRGGRSPVVLNYRRDGTRSGTRWWSAPSSTSGGTVCALRRDPGPATYRGSMPARPEATYARRRTARLELLARVTES